MNRYFIITLFAAFLSHSVNSQSSIDESKVSNAVNLIKYSSTTPNETEKANSLNSILNDVIITGAVFDNETKEPLEYATVTFFSKRENKMVGGSITDLQGKFNLRVPRGVYDISFDYFSFKSIKKLEYSLNTNTEFGVLKMVDNFLPF